MAQGSFVHIKFEWVGFHRWPSAPDSEKFLRDLHRHKFYAQIRMEVFHTDREIEFFNVLDWLEEHVLSHLKDERTETWSCEKMASYIGGMLRSNYGGDRFLSVTVLEDNENGGEVIWTGNQTGHAPSPKRY